MGYTDKEIGYRQSLLELAYYARQWYPFLQRQPRIDLDEMR